MDDNFCSSELRSVQIYPNFCAPRSFFQYDSRSVVFHSLLLFTLKKIIITRYFSFVHQVMNENVPCAKYLSATKWRDTGALQFLLQWSTICTGSKWSKIDLIYFAPVLQGHFICSTQHSFEMTMVWSTIIFLDTHAIMEQCCIVCARKKISRYQLYFT